MTVSALGAPLHGDPAADDNLRIFVLVNSPGITLSLDRVQAVPVASQSVVFSRLEPGPHAWTVTLADGRTASADFTLDASEMVESKGRRWWCLAAGDRAGQLTLLQLPVARCQALVDVAPD